MEIPKQLIFKKDNYNIISIHVADEYVTFYHISQNLNDFDLVTFKEKISEVKFI